MRVLQLIDTLQVGGAERMAVNFANALRAQTGFAALVTSRNSGPLESQLVKDVPFVCLYKKYAFDPLAAFKLRRFCKQHQIDWIHAHGTSYFTAFLVKLIYPKLKIVWHEHAGARSSEQTLNNIFLWICVRFFHGIIVVNQELESWCKAVLHFEKVIYLPNFTSVNPNEQPTTYLHGTASKRIVYLANLRHPKNHGLLLDVASKLKETAPDWTFHFIGQDKNDSYSETLKAQIQQKKLQASVYIYGLKEDIGHILNQASIAVIASSSEGLPVALLEYALYKKAVVSTDVGEIPKMIIHGANGYVVASGDSDAFLQAIKQLIVNDSLIAKFGLALHENLAENHSQDSVLQKYTSWLNCL
ncbi:glycosyltransferase [Flavobacterium sp. CYK-4]|uniref:glycosyltransferase n=1 Tax=Flavobacterium lotistagni TaxID=2709660 RepID=UPI00140E8286|nr:glycosyltransferase [Flavobacterium lotistagni]NHM06399.1 glycosyltransferase [Flavobacterium lotistagni]